jgi:excisionase family DNA binding protein
VTPDWKSFVVQYGRFARVHELAHVVGQPEAAVLRLRNRGVCSPGTRRRFHELFTLWHGRPPRDDEWPRPRKEAGSGYGWQAPELTLLASLVGRLGPADICRTLTARLRQVTGDPAATRTPASLNVALQRVGLQLSDVVGGLTANQAGRSIGCTSIVYNDIRHGRLKAFRVGRHLVIAHDEFARWKAARVFPPKGYVPLASIKRPLGIKSDKLSEYARAGRIPSAVRCNPYGTRAASTMFGTWWIPRALQRQLLADRRAGRPMPWMGTPDLGNLQKTWQLWQRRVHPPACAMCRTIWGKAGSPSTFEDYVQRYPPLAFGAKRHLTRPWAPGLTIPEVARHAGVSPATVSRAIAVGVLRATRHGRHVWVTRTDATRWKTRSCATGDHAHSWLSLATAVKVYGFRRRELVALIWAGHLSIKLGTAGPQRGLVYVLKQQVRELRERVGWPAADAARRLGGSVARLRTLSRALDWRDPDRFTLDVLTSIRKRLDSEAGSSIAAAARRLGQSVAWVERQIAHGRARVRRTPLTRRRYLSAPMVARLQAAVGQPDAGRPLSAAWLLVSDAALVGGVCANQIQRWSDAGEIATRMKGRFRRYHERSVKARARVYWARENRFKRATPPAWLVAEQKTSEAA